MSNNSAKIIKPLIQQAQFEDKHVAHAFQMQKQQIADISNQFSQKFDNLTDSITKILAQLQQPLDFERQESEFLER